MSKRSNSRVPGSGSEFKSNQSALKDIFDRFKYGHEVGSAGEYDYYGSNGTYYEPDSSKITTEIISQAFGANEAQNTYIIGKNVGDMLPSTHHERVLAEILERRK